MKHKPNTYVEIGESRNNEGLQIRAFTRQEAADLHNSRNRLYGHEAKHRDEFESIAVGLKRTSSEVALDQLFSLPVLCFKVKA